MYFSSGTFHLQLSFGVPSVCPGVVHSDVIQCSLLDDECVLLSILLEAILGIFVPVKLNILKEPGNEYKMSVSL